MMLRYRPLYDFENELNRMRNQLGEIFDRGSERPLVDAAAYPLLNAWEDDNCFYVEAELPGIALDDLDIFMADRNTVAIKGCRKEPNLEHGQWHRRERGFGCFERSMTLPGPVDEEHVEASFNHGVLMIKLPKAAELKPRKIEVKAS